MRRFRGFSDFAVDFTSETYLIGPNNAGKSTILNSLRLVDLQLRTARGRRPTLRVERNGISFDAYPASLEGFGSLRESVRHNFGTDEAVVELHWKHSVSCTIVWPAITDDDEDEDAPYFYLRYSNGGQPRDVREVRKYFPRLGIVPPLTPVENSEGVLSPDYVRSNMSSRLSSRHCRNQFWLLMEAGTYGDFLSFANDWTPEVRLTEIVKRSSSDRLDLYYQEGTPAREREITWAGDGLQVWFQILYHVHRLTSEATLILDEPEVYLHPDLQRRLVRLLESAGRQIVLATHSSEMVTEVDPSSIVLVDRSVRRGKRARDDDTMQAVSDLIGSQFNIRLAKALKSRVVLFVEGNDMRLLRKTAAKLGLSRFATEKGLAVVQLHGFSGHAHIEAFNLLCQDLLSGSVVPFVVLDRDYRSDAEVVAIEGGFASAGIAGHVWRRKELESYYLSAPTLAQVFGISESDADAMLLSATSSLKDFVLSRVIAARVQFAGPSKTNVGTVVQQAQSEFTAAWPDSQYQLQVCPAKDLLSQINSASQARSGKATSFFKLAEKQAAVDVPTEMRLVLEAVEGLLDAK